MGLPSNEPKRLWGRGQEVKELVSGNMDMRMTFKGFPASSGSPLGEVRLSGTMTVAMSSLP
jgi:hypothetical protein